MRCGNDSAIGLVLDSVHRDNAYEFQTELPWYETEAREPEKAVGRLRGGDTLAGSLPRPFVVLLVRAVVMLARCETCLTA